MKTISSIVIILLCFTAPDAQEISKKEYEKVFDYTVSKTNSLFPHIFEVVTEFIKNDKPIRTVTETNENEAPGRYRITRTEIIEGKRTDKYQVTSGFGNVFCSNDGTLWKSSVYECSEPVSFYPPRETAKTEYSVTEKLVDGKQVKIYREYSLFMPLKTNGKQEFREKITMIDSRGLFVNIEDTEGTLEPKIITLRRTQSWILGAKFKPVTAPLK